MVSLLKSVLIETFQFVVGSFHNLRPPARNPNHLRASTHLEGHAGTRTSEFVAMHASRSGGATAPSAGIERVLKWAQWGPVTSHAPPS
jgi:hypothetical protein